MILMILVFGAALVAAISLAFWYENSHIKKQYHDGVFRIVCALELPLEEWERKFRSAMPEDEWFGWQRGYQSGLTDALAFLESKTRAHIHGNRLVPIPEDLVES